VKKKEIDRLYEIAAWYNGLCETNNETFMPLFADTHRYLVLKGGGGSGKSIFAGRKVLERVTSEPGTGGWYAAKWRRPSARAASSS